MTATPSVAKLAVPAFDYDRTRYNTSMMNRPPRIPVEKTFDEFVCGFGGSKVLDLLALRADLRGSPPLNADYLFPADNVIAELKCLEEDTFSPDEFKEVFRSLMDDWQRRGVLPWQLFGGPIVVQSRDLPFVCQLELEKLISGTLRNVIKKANKQIRVTKETLQLPDAQGLLLLVSDGNYFLRPEQIFPLLGRILREHYSNISSVVYFTANATVDMPNLNRDGLVWIQSIRANVEPVSAEFLARLRAGWLQYLSRKLGIDIPEYVIDDASLVEAMRFIREVQIPIGGRTWATTSATHEFGDVYRLIGPTVPPSSGFAAGEFVRAREKRNRDGAVVLEVYEKVDMSKMISLKKLLARTPARSN